MKAPPDTKALANLQFYRKLNPGFSITDTPFIEVDSEYKFRREEQERHNRQIAIEGYFNSTPIIEQSDLVQLRKLVASIHQAGILPIFASVYDEFWQLQYKLRQTFNHLLRADYHLRPDFWIWHISPNESHGGWTPHRDAEIVEAFGKNSLLRRDRSPISCTIWIPLTNANPHNSCIYVIPFSKDNLVQRYLNGDNSEKIAEAAASTPIVLNQIRALPAKAGTVLGWSPYLFHGGSLSSQWASSPRMSIGIYLHAKDAPKQRLPSFNDKDCFVDWQQKDYLLPFESRLRIITNILNTYKESNQLHLEENMHERFLEFSDKIRAILNQS